MPNTPTSDLERVLLDGARELHDDTARRIAADQAERGEPVTVFHDRVDAAPYRPEAVAR